MTAKQIEDILLLYQKHGWTLRRVLLSAKLKKQIADSLQIFSETEIIEAQIDAAWFSRASGKDREAWELRRLSETPYALFEVFETGERSEIGEEIRREMESKLK